MLKTKKKTLKIEAETYPGVREWGRGKCFQVTLLLEKCIISMWLMCLCELEPPPPWKSHLFHLLFQIKVMQALVNHLEVSLDLSLWST